MRVLLSFVFLIAMASSQSIHEQRVSACTDQSLTRRNDSFAYVLFVAFPSQPAHRDFWLSALTTAHSIRLTGSTADIVFMVLGGLDDDDSAVLESFGIKVIHTAPLLPLHDQMTHEERLRIIYATHLRVLSLTQYSKIISLDADVMVTANLDELFHHPSDFLIKQGFNAPVNTGFFVAKPSCTDFEAMEALYAADEWDSESGWAHSGAFPHWRPDRRGALTNWQFHSSSSDQGLVFYYYFRRSFDTSSIKVELWPLLSHDDLFVHFMGKTKPFHVRPDELLRISSSLKRKDDLQQWYNIYFEMKDVANKAGLQSDLTLEIIRNQRTPLLIDNNVEDVYTMCVVSQWGAWSACSVPCGGGSRTRTRTVSMMGDNCPATQQSVKCNNQTCEHFKCSADLCGCVNKITNQTSNATQIHSVAPSGCGSSWPFKIDPSWNWDPVCNVLEVCYGQCNTAKKLCDTNFVAGLRTACQNVSKSERQSCDQTIPQFRTAITKPTVYTQWKDAQQADCSCNATSVYSSRSRSHTFHLSPSLSLQQGCGGAYCMTCLMHMCKGPDDKDCMKQCDQLTGCVSCN